MNKVCFVKVGVVVAMSCFLVGCSKGGGEGGEVPGEKVVAPGEKVGAKFDPNLKAENVVWDSQERKEAYEAMMAGKSASSASSASSVKK